MTQPIFPYIRTGSSDCLSKFRRSSHHLNSNDRQAVAIVTEMMILGRFARATFFLSSSTSAITKSLSSSLSTTAPAFALFESSQRLPISAKRHTNSDTALFSTTTSTMSASYLCVKPGTEEAFKEASLKNARSSALESGVARFDVLQDNDDKSKFILVEVYKNSDVAPVAHKETAHYAEWRDTVADMMAEARTARKFTNLFPTTSSGWDYPIAEQLE